MTEDRPTQLRAAQEALALAAQVSAPAARAARRSVRRYLLAMGAAMSLATLGSGLVSRWGDTWTVLPRALVTGALWAALVGALLALANAEPVRAVPARRQTIMIVAASAVLIGATMALGRHYVLAYPIGAAATFGVWAFGAARVGR